jgi:basic membrane lipoprotein Med (substrate-binding protein (PBP1-ABC) superfamily)
MKNVRILQAAVLGLGLFLCLAPLALAEKMSIAMVTDVGGVNDQSFNQSAWEGLQRAEKDFGIKVAYKESKQDADYGPNMETLTDAGYDLIWGIGFLMGDAIKETAEINPDQKYAIIDFSYGPETPGKRDLRGFSGRGALFSGRLYRRQNDQEQQGRFCRRDQISADRKV